MNLFDVICGDSRPDDAEMFGEECASQPTDWLSVIKAHMESQLRGLKDGWKFDRSLEWADLETGERFSFDDLLGVLREAAKEGDLEAIHLINAYDDYTGIFEGLPEELRQAAMGG